MAQQVRSLEIFPELADAARRNLAALGMRDVEGTGRGCPQHRQRRALRSHCGDRLAAALRCALRAHADARRALFVVVGEAPIMEARLVRRTAEDAWSTESLFETVIDPLVHAVRPAEFTF